MFLLSAVSTQKKRGILASIRAIRAIILTFANKTTFMKNIFLLLTVLLFISCKKENKKEDLHPESENNQIPVELGQEIFEGKGNCVACHLMDKKVIGPSIQDMAKIYKEQKGDIIDFLKNDAKPIIDPSQYEVMKTNFVITKAMSDEELKAIEAYIYSNSK
jgi:cytochrome c